MNRALSAATLKLIAAALVGLVAGYGLATYRQKVVFDVEQEIRQEGIVDY